MAIFQDNLTWEMRYQNVFVLDFLGANGDNWMAPWKNWISSTTIKLEKITRKASDAAEYIQLFGSSAEIVVNGTE